MKLASEATALAACCVGVAVILQGCGQSSDKYRPQIEVHNVRPSPGPTFVPPELTTAQPTGNPGCPKVYEDCRSARCCYNQGYSCFEKNAYWAACRPDCKPGIFMKDPIQFRTNWTCAPLLPTTKPPQTTAGPTRQPLRPQPENCTEDGLSCNRDTKCCPGLSCFEKDATWSGCRKVCLPGIDPSDPVALQSPWSCKLIAGPEPGGDPLDGEAPLDLSLPQTTTSKAGEIAAPQGPVGGQAAVMLLPKAGGSVPVPLPLGTALPPSPFPAPKPGQAMDLLAGGGNIAPASNTMPAWMIDALSTKPSTTTLATTTTQASASCSIAEAAEGPLQIAGVPGGTFVQGDGGAVAGDRLTMHHNSGYSVMTGCGQRWQPGEFAQFKLVGRTISFNVDLSKVGCACNLAFYLVSAPAFDYSGFPSKGECDASPFYCDANRVCGQFCPEIDIMEANNHVFQATPHRCDPPTNQGHYNLCDRNGCAENTRNIPNAYGPGAGFTIDTTRPFVVATSFNGNGNSLTGMVTSLQQEGRQVSLSHGGCDPSYLAQVGGAMARGMSLRITYWGDDADTMNWMDMPPCGPEACQGANAGDGVISGIKVEPPQTESMSVPVKAAPAPPPPPPPPPVVVPQPQQTARPMPLETFAPSTSIRPTVPPGPPTTTAYAVPAGLTPAPSGQQGSCSKAWHQCGGKGWQGPQCCTSDSHCVHYNEWFWQCVAKPSPTPAPTPAPPAPQPPPPAAPSPPPFFLPPAHTPSFGDSSQGNPDYSFFRAPPPPPPRPRPPGPNWLRIANTVARNTLCLILLSGVLYVLAVLLFWLRPSWAPKLGNEGICQWTSLLPVPHDCVTSTGCAACRCCASFAARLGLSGLQRSCENAEGKVRDRVEELTAASRTVNQIIRYPVDRFQKCWQSRFHQRG